MTTTAHPEQELLTMLHQSRDAYVKARIAAMEAMDAENWARWKFQQAVNACINCGIDPVDPSIPF
jgi:hypothetical protein